MTSLDPSHLPDLSRGEHKSREQAVYRTANAHLPAIPDLRFEQSYLKSIAPFVHVRHPTSPNDEGEQTAVIIDWQKVAWITTRDQVISPLVQGAVWGFASQFLLPFFRHTFSQLFWSSTPPRSASSGKKGGELTRRLREWSRSLTTSGLQANIALRK